MMPASDGQPVAGFTDDRGLTDRAGEAAGVGSWQWDPRTGVVSLSSLAAAMLNLRAAARIPFADFVALLHPDDRTMADQVLRTSATEQGGLRHGPPPPWSGCVSEGGRRPTRLPAS